MIAHPGIITDNEADGMPTRFDAESGRRVLRPGSLVPAAFEGQAFKRHQVATINGNLDGRKFITCPVRS